MSNLPEGWESDYDGSRWFYRYQSTGIIQYHFPQPGDEFPEFFDPTAGAITLAPEERLASERQVKRRSTVDGNQHGASLTKTSGSGRKKGSRKDDSGMSATGYFDPASFMEFGLGGDGDLSPVEDDDEDDLSKGKAVELASSQVSPTPITASPHGSTVASEIATGEAVARMPVHAELPGESAPSTFSPVGFMAELASADTTRCAEELAPVEMDATPWEISINGFAELPTQSSPIEKKEPPKPTSHAVPPNQTQIAPHNPLVSASFASPPARLERNPLEQSQSRDHEHQQPAEPEPSQLRQHEHQQPQYQQPAALDQQPQHTSQQSSRPPLSNGGQISPPSSDVGPAKYQPWTPAKHIVEDVNESSKRSSMVLSGVSVLQSQNTELGAARKRHSMAGPTPVFSIEPAASAPPDVLAQPADPRNLGRPSRGASAVDGPPQSPIPASLQPAHGHLPPRPAKVPFDDAGPSTLQPPGSGQYSQEIATKGQDQTQSNPAEGGQGLTHVPSVLKPAYLRSNAAAAKTPPAQTAAGFQPTPRPYAVQKPTAQPSRPTYVGQQPQHFQVPAQPYRHALTPMPSQMPGANSASDHRPHAHRVNTVPNPLPSQGTNNSPPIVGREPQPPNHVIATSANPSGSGPMPVVEPSVIRKSPRPEDKSRFSTPGAIPDQAPASAHQTGPAAGEHQTGDRRSSGVSHAAESRQGQRQRNPMEHPSFGSGNSFSGLPGPNNSPSPPVGMRARMDSQSQSISISDPSPALSMSPFTPSTVGPTPPPSAPLPLNMTSPPETPSQQHILASVGAVQTQNPGPVDYFAPHGTVKVNNAVSPPSQTRPLHGQQPAQSIQMPTQQHSGIVAAQGLSGPPTARPHDFVPREQSQMPPMPAAAPFGGAESQNGPLSRQGLPIQGSTVPPMSTNLPQQERVPAPASAPVLPTEARSHRSSVSSVSSLAQSQLPSGPGSPANRPISAQQIGQQSPANGYQETLQHQQRQNPVSQDRAQNPPHSHASLQQLPPSMSTTQGAPVALQTQPSQPMSMPPNGNPMPRQERVPQHGFNSAQHGGGDRPPNMFVQNPNLPPNAVPGPTPQMPQHQGGQFSMQQGQGPGPQAVSQSAEGRSKLQKRRPSEPPGAQPAQPMTMRRPGANGPPGAAAMPQMSQQAPPGTMRHLSEPHIPPQGAQPGQQMITGPPGPRGPPGPVALPRMPQQAPPGTMRHSSEPHVPPHSMPQGGNKPMPGGPPALSPPQSRGSLAGQGLQQQPYQPGAGGASPPDQRQKRTSMTGQPPGNMLQQKTTRKPSVLQKPPPKQQGGVGPPAGSAFPLGVMPMVGAVPLPGLMQRPGSGPVPGAPLHPVTTAPGPNLPPGVTQRPGSLPQAAAVPSGMVQQPGGASYQGPVPPTIPQPHQMQHTGTFPPQLQSAPTAQPPAAAPAKESKGWFSSMFGSSDSQPPAPATGPPGPIGPSMPQYGQSASDPRQQSQPPIYGPQRSQPGDLTNDRCESTGPAPGGQFASGQPSRPDVNQPLNGPPQMNAQGPRRPSSEQKSGPPGGQPQGIPPQQPPSPGQVLHQLHGLSGLPSQTHTPPPQSSGPSPQGQMGQKSSNKGAALMQPPQGRFPSSQQATMRKDSSGPGAMPFNANPNTGPAGRKGGMVSAAPAGSSASGVIAMKPGAAPYAPTSLAPNRGTAEPSQQSTASKKQWTSSAIDYSGEDWGDEEDYV